MRAFVLSDFGATPALVEIPDPQPQPGEVLVRVRAASLNGFDLAVAAGYLQGMMEHRFPVVIGKDFAGTVESVGEGVESFSPGDEVFGVVMKPELGDGSIAERVTVSTGIGIAKRPAGLPVEDAAALGLAGTAALQAVEAAEIGSGDTVLISGATGGVGAFAVQLAAARGARVIATTRGGEAAAFVKELGAEASVTYTDDLAAQVREIAPAGVDAVLHFAGDAAALVPLVKQGGRVVSTLGLRDDAVPNGGVTVIPVNASPSEDALDTLASSVANGTLRVPVQKTYALSDVPAALADFGRGTRGKLVVYVADEASR